MSHVTSDLYNAFAYAPRSVRPRSRKHTPLPVIAIYGSDALDEDGQMIATDELTRSLPERSATLFVTLGAAAFLAELNRQFAPQHGDRWQWRVSIHERDLIRPDGFKAATRVSTTVHFFGWKGRNYHKLIDPITMYGHRLDTIWPGDEPPLVRLLRWGVALRDFCQDNNLDIRPTMGSISSQFLTDRRFYPQPRRKVPMGINDRARENLPGNHYTLYVIPSPHEYFTATYLDQRRAHHYHASHIHFPHSDHLYAYGRFTDLAEVVWQEIPTDFYGLLCLDLHPSRNSTLGDSFLCGNELTKRFVFTNELQHLLDLGFTVTGIRAAWGSRLRDRGLPRYARWANEQLDRYNDAPWLKPLLLSTYGTLATRPRYGEAVFRLAKGGEPVAVRAGKHGLNGHLVRASKKLEPGIANVIHRGMIEAATRSESVGLAQYLTFSGHRILSIYADAVIVEHNDDKPLPPLPEPWRIKRQLTHLQFINQQAFISDEMTKLPGVSREMRPYRQHTMPGWAPRVVQYEVLTGKPVLTGRRI